MENNIKVLTLWQPWATLHAHGIKRDETRPKETSHKGTYLVHAAEKFPVEARELCLEEPFKSELAKLGYHSWRDLPTAAIVGSVEYTACFNIENEKVYKACWKARMSDWPNEIAFGNYAEGRWVWHGQNHQAFKTPIPYKNGQGYYRNFDVNKLKDHEAAFKAIQEAGGALREETARQIEEIYQKAKEALETKLQVSDILQAALLFAPEALDLQHYGIIGHRALAHSHFLPHSKDVVVVDDAAERFEIKVPKALPLPTIKVKKGSNRKRTKETVKKTKFSKKKFHSLTTAK